MSKREFLARALTRGRLLSPLRLASRWSGVVALNYHRIGNPAGTAYDRALWSATAETFAAQIRFCKQHLEVISVTDLPSALASGTGRYGLITFDDGYHDNYNTAFPILGAERVPATFFVTTGFIDSPRVPWWDEIAWMVRTSVRQSVELPSWLPHPLNRESENLEPTIQALLRRYKSLPTDDTASYLDAVAAATESGRCAPPPRGELWMTWDQLREMNAAGMTIGGHTVTHPILARAPATQQRAEIQGCGARLLEELGTPMRVFSYPVGGLSSFEGATRDLLRAAGVSFAFSYYGGYRRFDSWDSYDVRRVPVETDVSSDLFASIVNLPGIFA